MGRKKKLWDGYVSIRVRQESWAAWHAQCQAHGMIANRAMDHLIAYAAKHDLLREIFREFCGPPSPHPHHDLGADVTRQEVKEMTKPGVIVVPPEDDSDVEAILGGQQ
jgi:hypothetical protein